MSRKQWIILLVAVVFSAWLGGATVAWFSSSAAWARTRKPQALTVDSISTRELRIVDEEGFPRGFIRGAKTGAVLHLLGWQGPGFRVEVGRPEKGDEAGDPHGAVLDLGETGDPAHLRLIASANGNAGLVIQGAGPFVPGRKDVQMGNEAGVIFIMDAQGQIIWKAPPSRP